MAHSLMSTHPGNISPEGISAVTCEKPLTMNPLGHVHERPRSDDVHVTAYFFLVRFFKRDLIYVVRKIGFFFGLHVLPTAPL